MNLIAPSLLAADFGNLEREMEWFNRSEADWLHLDVMDGVFSHRCVTSEPPL